MSNFYKLWKHFSSKRKKQIVLIIILMLITSITEMIGIGLFYPLFQVILNPDQLFENNIIYNI